MYYKGTPADLITGVVVNYCTPEAIHKAVTSLRRFYPFMRIIIIDGSPKGTPGWQMCEHLKSVYTNTIHVEFNIGHGRGMNVGISMVLTPLVLLFDSDTDTREKGVLEIMLTKFNEQTERPYGIGQVLITSKEGTNAEHGIKYLHPHFALIDRVMFYQFLQYVDHGAPMIAAMNDIHKSYKDLLIDFPELKDYVFHVGKVTRRLKPKEFNPRNWVKKF
jgi:hypothetical protein